MKEIKLKKPEAEHEVVYLEEIEWHQLELPL